ncbi:MAG: T9SS type A sorting domain-containing protein, partial [Candidatus Marinimicrobia bacterium]|nr:T9SS type A sorting domain-containing protein [Candidatus Neomarinimicrobiota bacterium]
SSTIVAGNSGRDIHRYENGNVISNGNNIIGNLDSTGIFTIDHDNGMDWVGGYDDSTGSIISGDTNFVNTYSNTIDPQLVLVDDGETAPHAMPYPGSISVDNGSSTYTLATDPSTVLELEYDVRGMPRTWITETDIGSIERQASDLFGEQIPPAMINDLSAEPSLDGGLVLNWTSVGEDGINGTADHYRVYYGTETFSSELDPDVSSIVLPIEPAYSGNSESFYFSELDYGTEYYLAVVAFDIVGQSSPLAGPVSMATMQPPVAEITVNEVSITLPAESEGSRYGTITNTGESNLNYKTKFSEDEAQTRNASDKVLFVTGAYDNGASVFYWLDVATGEIQELGELFDENGVAIGGSEAGNYGITAIAQNPVDKVWYGVETEGRLFSFTPGDSNATIIGEHTATGHISDMDFGPDGTLYGWSEGCDCLTKINLETAEVDEFGTQELSTWGTGLAIDPNIEVAYMKRENEFYTIDLASGLQIGDYISLDGPDYLVNMLDIGPEGDIYTGLRTNWDDGEFVFCTIDTSDGTVTQLYTYDIEYVSAISVEASDWLTTDPNKGMLSSGESAQIAINYSSIGLEDSTYTGQLLFETNDPSAENTVFNITLTVSGDNLPPVLLTEALPNAVEDEAYSFQLEGSDSNGDAISYSLTSGPDWLGISETGELDGTPANEHVGDSLMITVSITDGMSAVESVFYISVVNTNDAPAVAEALADVEVDEDAEPLTIDLSQAFGDQDAGDLLGYSVQGYLTFRKANNADWTMEENQDRVADNVWLTRQNSQSIFNIALEDAYSSASQSPVGTEWAYGHAAHTEGLTFQHFKAAVNNSPPSSIGKPLVLHTIDEDAYYDIMVHHWAGGSPGGGFAWTRSSGEVPIMTPEINGSNLVLHFHPNASGETELVIVATDQSGATALDTMGITVNPVNDSPGDFTLLVPENNSVVSDLTPTFTWDTPVDPDNSESMGEIGVGESSDKVTTINHTQVATRSIESYNVYIGIAPDFTPEDVVATVSTNYYTHEEELEENEVYYWMIEAVDNDGGGTISDTWSFTINSENLPPSLFALISPDSGVILNTQEVNFEWEASVDMDPMDGVHYSIDIHSDTTHIHFETESTSIASGNLMDNSIYHWGVRAFDMYGGMTENIGGPDMFVINVANDAPSAASLVAPLDGSIQTNLSPNFFWTRSFDPDPMDHVSYSMDVWAVGGTESQSISTDSNGVTIDFALMDNSMYGFQVIAFDIDDGESQSDTSHFYTDAFPEPPLNFTTVSPQNESQGLATEVEFKWNMTQDPDPVDDIHYQLVYATNWDDSSTYVYSALVQDTSLTLTLEDDNQYFWLVEARDTDEFVVGSNNNTPMTLVVGTLGIDGHQIPEVFALHQNYPNPFNPTTTIRYDLPEPTQVRIHIVDIIGRKVSTIVNEHQNPGFKSVVWDALDEFGSPVGAGMYFYIIEAGEFQQTRKMILLK